MAPNTSPDFQVGEKQLRDGCRWQQYAEVSKIEQKGRYFYGCFNSTSTRIAMEEDQL
jgi:hypothetical protein